jgi:hypothetical protein
VQTYSLDQAAAIICGETTLRDPRRWVATQIRAGKFSALRLAGRYRMTEAQVAEALEALTVNAKPAEPAVTRLGPTAASLRRRRSA